MEIPFTGSDIALRVVPFDEPEALAEMEPGLRRFGAFGILLERAEKALLGGDVLAQFLFHARLTLEGDRGERVFRLLEQRGIGRRPGAKGVSILLQNGLGIVKLVLDQIEHGNLIACGERESTRRLEAVLICGPSGRIVLFLMVNAAQLEPGIGNVLVAEHALE